MKISRRFTTAGDNPFDSVTWTLRSARISNPDGSVVFEMTGAEVPASWSQLATDIMVSKYFRKAGVPKDGGPRGLPSPEYEPSESEPDSQTSRDREGADSAPNRSESGTGPERSVRQVIHRLAGCWRWWGQQHGYFDSDEDAQAFEDELKYMMVHQMAAPNSPQWFNTGLNWAYGITGPAQGHWYVDPGSGEVRPAEDAYSHPQPHACFIQSIEDDLVNPGGIMDLWVREARLFKYGSGTGTNFSRLRAEDEPLSGGGKSSGLMSWLRIGDRAAAAIKSGGTTRRAAKMVCLDMDHPDIERFIDWKVREEVKVAAMVEGLRCIRERGEPIAEAADRVGLSLDYDFNGEAYQTVSGQNSNNSIRIPDAFFDALDAGADWQTHWRTTGRVARVFKASDLWDRIAYAAWRCADPGVQFDTTINAWHTCPGAGRINASNPCSEYMFLDNTACNLASLNVLRFYDEFTRTFDADAFEHAVRLWTIVLEISVLMAAFPSARIAELSHRYRTLGLGYANLGAMLMRAGIPYDSDQARAICGTITAILSGRAACTSAQMARQLGAFPAFEPDRENMLRVIRNHRRAAIGTPRDSDDYEGLRIRPVPIDHDLVRSGRVGLANAGQLLDRAVAAWDEALALGREHGYRNAQMTVIAPTGTIGLLMDCDTTGVEPDFALVKFKKLAGGGYFKIVNASVAPALKTLGYTPEQIAEIQTHIVGALHLDVPMPPGAGGAQPGETLAQWLRGKGLSEEDLERIVQSLAGVFDLAFAFAPWALGPETIRRAGLDPESAQREPGFNLLSALGLSGEQIKALNVAVCGTQTIEGAPHVRAEHLPVFDCANACGETGTRSIAPEGHIRMMAAAQPFICGAISKTINLSNDADLDLVKRCYRLSWELGLKANALYRDGSKLSQPLNTTSDVDLEDKEVDELGESQCRDEVATAVSDLAEAVAGERVEVAVERHVEIVHRPMRRRLPDTRHSITHKFNVAGHEGYLTVGLYDDGKPGELFVTMAKEGSTIGGLMDCLGTAISVALQYGVPIESLVNKFTHQRFEPAGMTHNPDIPIAKSLVDYIFRWMGMEFLPGYREINAPKRSSDATADPVTQAPGLKPSPPRRTTTQPRPTDLTDGSDRPPIARDRIGNGTNGAGSPPPGTNGDGTVAAETLSAQETVLSVAMRSMGDAPPCDVCGTITVRGGTCYKCVNCGNSMGCS